jgi:SAM-dependent methyltransferase
VAASDGRSARYYDEELPLRATRPVPHQRAEHLQVFIERCTAEGLTSVVEVGCGAGRDGVVLRDAGLTYVGVDLSPVGVQLCRDAGLEAWEASAIDLPFADNSFDGGWSMSTLMHLEGAEMDAAVAEIGRVIRSGGVLEVGVWGAEAARNRVDEHGRLFQQRSDPELRRLLSSVGTLDAFETWDWSDDGGHYQWGRVLIR